MNPKKWSIENRVYLEAETYEQAVSKFWDLMEKQISGRYLTRNPRRIVSWTTWKKQEK